MKKMNLFVNVHEEECLQVKMERKGFLTEDIIPYEDGEEAEWYTVMWVQGKLNRFQEQPELWGPSALDQLTFFEIDLLVFRINYYYSCRYLNSYSK